MRCNPGDVSSPGLPNTSPRQPGAIAPWVARAPTQQLHLLSQVVELDKRKEELEQRLSYMAHTVAQEAHLRELVARAAAKQRANSQQE